MPQPPRRLAESEETAKKSRFLELVETRYRHDGARPPANQAIDVWWWCLVENGQRGPLLQRSIRRAISHQQPRLMDLVRAEYDRILTYENFEAWYRDTGARFGCTEAQFRTRLTAQGLRWATKTPQLPDAWALVERLSLACVLTDRATVLAMTSVEAFAA